MPDVRTALEATVSGGPPSVLRGPRVVRSRRHVIDRRGSGHPVEVGSERQEPQAAFQATLVTGDPEIRPPAGTYDLTVEWLPQPRATP
jgi:hypothetical protein